MRGVPHSRLMRLGASSAVLSDSAISALGSDQRLSKSYCDFGVLGLGVVVDLGLGVVAAGLDSAGSPTM